MDIEEKEDIKRYGEYIPTRIAADLSINQPIAADLSINQPIAAKLDTDEALNTIHAQAIENNDNKYGLEEYDIKDNANYMNMIENLNCQDNDEHDEHDEHDDEDKKTISASVSDNSSELVHVCPSIKN